MLFKPKPTTFARPLILRPKLRVDDADDDEFIILPSNNPRAGTTMSTFPFSLSLSLFLLVLCNVKLNYNPHNSRHPMPSRCVWCANEPVIVTAVY